MKNVSRWFRKKSQYSINKINNCHSNNLKYDENAKSINKEKHLIQNEALNLEIPVEKSNFPLRDKWGSSTEFVLSCIGWSVGFGNVWRFPYLAYKNGGGAFLFPYFILLILIGKPMYFMEVALGQFCSLGPLSVWRCFPLGKGVGVAMIVVSFIQSISYNVLMAYTLFFLAQSFQAVIPWSNCFEWWGADSSCYVRNIHQVKCVNMKDTVMLCNVNKTTMMNVSNMINCTNATQTASEQFWERYVLQLSSGIDEIGSIKWDLALSLFIAWLIVFLCLIKGVKSSGKVIYFTATSPYIILISLFIYGATLDGASDGIYFLFVPKWERLTDLKIWLAAAEQLFYSLGLSWGSLIMFGSYNHFHNKIHKQALLVSSLDFITSLLASLVIFCVLGMLAKETGLCIDEVVKADQGLAFVVYPEALATLWLPQLWTFLFFMMMLLLGIDSEFALLETLTTVIYDEFPKLRKYKITILLFLCSLCFLLGLPCVTQGGAYIFNIMHTYGAGFPLLFIAICELLSIMWGYGMNRLCCDFEMMLGIKINYYFKANWLVISPVILSIIFIYGISTHERLAYNDQNNPDWAETVGWILALSSMIQIPLWAVITLIKYRNNLHQAIYPTSDWGPEDVVIKNEWLKMVNEMKVKYLHKIVQDTTESQL
ncbi:sodium-dependent proline transporter-like [Centruroides vittatus]|uniref:sodium-dependent proline transporter-like n=1 Tax=Centruroides vittatus TaxID=120091 RepID=UPI0035101380